jgi:hypothetical protein
VKNISQSAQRRYTGGPGSRKQGKFISGYVLEAGLKGWIVEGNVFSGEGVRVRNVNNQRKKGGR